MKNVNFEVSILNNQFKPVCGIKTSSMDKVTSFLEKHRKQAEKLIYRFKDNVVDEPVIIYGG